MVDKEQIEDMVRGDGGGSRFWWTRRCIQVTTALGTALLRQGATVSAFAESALRFQWELLQLSLLQRIVGQRRGRLDKGCCRCRYDHHCAG